MKSHFRSEHSFFDIPKEVDILNHFFYIHESGDVIDPITFVEGERYPSFSYFYTFCGGLTRDLYYNQPYSDIDVLMTSFLVHKLHQKYEGFFTIENNNELKFDMPFINHKFNFHIMQPNFLKHVIYPRDFDFTINQLCLSPYNILIAKDIVWNDLEKRILRITQENIVTKNTLFRGIRFMHDYGLTMDETTEKMFYANKKKMRIKPINNYSRNERFYLLKNLKKFKERYGDQKATNILEDFNKRFFQEYKNINEMINVLEESSIEAAQEYNNHLRVITFSENETENVHRF